MTNVTQNSNIEFSKSSVCQLLNIQFPILQGGMTLVGTAKLASAVSQGGGLGVVSAGRMEVAAFERELDDAISMTDKPLGINIPVGRNVGWMKACFHMALQRNIKVVFIGGGNPKPWIPLVKDAGKLLGVVVASPQQAFKAEVAGADLVIAESIEAGGRTSREELAGVPLIPATSDRISIPLVAAGGFVDGRGLAAALALGADAVQMGTRFMLAQESPLHEATRKVMLASEITDTLVVGSSRGMGRRYLRNATSERIIQIEDKASLDDMVAMLSGEWSKQGLHYGNLQQGLIACGQGIGLIHEDLPAAAIIATIVRQAEEHCQRAVTIVRKSAEATN